MKRSRFSDEHIIAILKEQEAGMATAEVCRRLKHGFFHTFVDPQAAINRFIREYNANSPQLFIWKAKPDDIIAARYRGFQTLESIH